MNHRLKETLSNCLCGMKRKAHGAQEPRHIEKYVEVTSTAQRSDSPAQTINQSFLKSGNELNDSHDDPAEERPPVFRTWRRLYFAVLGNLILLIVIFYILTRIFSK